MFSGIGGICLGFKQAGFKIAWANDIDADAVKTYIHNFGGGYVALGDIRKIDVKTIPYIDVLTAGFPCQPFSLRGKQLGFKDPRGNLFFEIGRVIDVKRPQVVFIENVANLALHDDGRTFLVIYNTLAQFGYYVTYKVLDAYTHGDVPQKRERIFVVASTLKANMGTFPDRVPALCDDYGIRKITPTECLALQGFPTDYTFPKGTTLNVAYKQVGNTVSVPVVRRIAEKIAEALA
jgi:DNA (cytosine-5)-methyltransferase 1